MTLDISFHSQPSSQPPDSSDQQRNIFYGEQAVVSLFTRRSVVKRQNYNIAQNKKKDIEFIAVSEETYNWLFSIKNVSLLIRGVRRLR